MSLGVDLRRMHADMALKASERKMAKMKEEEREEEERNNNNTILIGNVGINRTATMC